MQNNKRPQRGDALLAHNTARAFFELAGTFFGSLPADINEREKYLAHHKGKLIAATVNLAFSLELYFKVLAMGTLGHASHEHNLLKLFKMLPSDIQENIDERYRYRIKNDRNQRLSEVDFCISPFDAEPTEDEKNGCRLNSAAGEDVYSLLEAEKETFLIWRYLYEKPKGSSPICVTIHYHRLGVLVNAVQDQFFNIRFET